MYLKLNNSATEIIPLQQTQKYLVAKSVKIGAFFELRGHLVYPLKLEPELEVSVGGTTGARVRQKEGRGPDVDVDRGVR